MKFIIFYEGYNSVSGDEEDFKGSGSESLSHMIHNRLWYEIYFVATKAHSPAKIYVLIG